MPEYAITYENDFPFVLYASTEVSTTARTAAISRSSYQFCTVEFVREGAGFLDINGKSFHVRKNGVYFLTPGSTHTYWPDRSDPWHKIFFVIGGDLMPALLEAYKLESVYHIPDCPELKKYFEAMKTLRYDSVVSNQQASVLFHQFLQEASLLVYGVKSRLPEEIEKLKLALDGAVEENFRLETFAAGLQITEAHLIRQFRAHFQQTPYEYLMNRKMESACRLLLYSTLSVKEIAARLAFSDQYYFSNYFKRKNGLSPRLYRTKFQHRRTDGGGQ